MNTPKVAAALNTISLAFGELAEALTDPGNERIEAAPEAPQAPVTAHEASPFVDLPDEAPAPQGALAVCPKHRIPYTSGQYGEYCQQTTDDPAWGKQKGDRLWCRITPKNAADWLRVTAA